MPDGINMLKPLHGIGRLRPDGRVLVVSGVETATKLRDVLPDVSVLAGRAADYNFAPLAGRIVVADDEALAQAILAAGALKAGAFAIGPVVQALESGAGGPAVEAAIRANVRAVQPLAQPATTVEDVADGDVGELPRYEVQDGGAPIDDDQAPFRCLGYDRRRYYFIRSDGGQVIDLSARDLRDIGCLLELAPANYWEERYPGGRTFDTTAAANHLIAMSRIIGIFDPDRIRGRGAWLDEGRAVLHMGDRLLVDGRSVPVQALATHFHYELARAMPVALSEPLAATEAKKLYDLCRLIQFEEDETAPLFCGFLVVAPVCGAMRWRTHGWLTGESGSGKSWVLDHIMRPVIGSIALRVQSKSTEAGVRQLLVSDSRPVVFDEAETQNNRDRERVQQILDLARQASSEDGAPIAKGTQGGRAQTFNIRSSFVFSSINLGLEQAADESRTLIFSLASRGNMTEEGQLAAVTRFAKLEKTVAELLTPEFCGGLLARTVALLPVIRANSEVFARALAERFGSRRQGDTLAAPMAGLYSLHSNRQITIDEARKFIGDKVWVQKAAQRTEVVRDQERALDYLLEQNVRVQPPTGPAMERPLVSLIAAAWAASTQLDGSVGGETVEGVSPPVAIQHLGFLGIKVDRGSGLVWMARAHSRFAQLFANTPWAGSWETMMARIPGAVKVSPKTERFGQLVKRAVGVPIEAIIKPDQ